MPEMPSNPETFSVLERFEQDMEAIAAIRADDLPEPETIEDWRARSLPQ